jgi:hypothetical protein
VARVRVFDIISDDLNVVGICASGKLIGDSLDVYRISGFLCIFLELALGQGFSTWGTP